MTLRDHFHSPVNDKHRWDAVHGGWPMMIVQTLYKLLPPGFVAEPLVHHPAPFEVDISMTEDDDRLTYHEDQEGGTATQLLEHPTLTIPVDLDEQDEYEVRVYDTNRQRTLVAAIEIISPANKDRPETRERFVSKVAALLRQDVCVSIIDIVTLQQANLYVELLAKLGQVDPQLGAQDTGLYAVTLRGRKPYRKRPLLDAWYYPLSLGQVLPSIPIWLTPELPITLSLQASYAELCRLLRIG